MLHLKIGSTKIETTNVEIPIVLRSPLFETPDNKIPGSFAFNFPVPLTPELKKELQHAHRPARKGKPTWTHPFEMQYGPLRYSGIATITQTTAYASDQKPHPETVEINFPIATGDLALILNDKTLKDLPTTETIDYGTALSYTAVSMGYRYLEVQEGEVFTSNIEIKPDSIGADPQHIYNPDNNTWKIKQTGTYQLHCVINSHFDEFLYGGSSIPYGRNRRFKMTLNGDVVVDEPIDLGTQLEHWQYNSFIYKETFNFNQNDIVRFFVLATAQQHTPHGIQYFIILNIDPNTSIVFDGVNEIFQNIIDKTYPEVNYAAFPFKNKMLLDATPESLYRIDMNDIKTFHQSFMSITNYYLDDRFPYVVSGHKNGQFHILLNPLAPSPYLAHIFDLIFQLIQFTPLNNPFTTAELKRAVLTSNFIINNYFHDNQPITLKEFLPGFKLADFIRNICTLFGITFTVNTQARTILFKFIDDILADTTSIPFSENVESTIEIKTEDIRQYVVEYKNIPCEFTSKNAKPLEDITVLDTLPTPEELPETGNVNDCYYIEEYRYYAIWQYDEGDGIYKWIFYSINFTPILKGDTLDKDENTLKIDLNLTTTADYFYDPEFIPGPGAPERPYLIPAYDDTLGNLVVGRLWLIPAFFASTNFRELPSQYRQEEKAVIHFYHGMYNDINGNSYPFASAGTYDTNFNPVPGATLSLRLDDANGIYHKKWEKFIQWRLNSPGEYKFHKHLTPLQIHNLDFLRWHEILGTHYLIKEIRFNITNTHITPAEIIAHRR